MEVEVVGDGKREKRDGRITREVEGIAKIKGIREE